MAFEYFSHAQIYSKESVCRMGGEQALGKGMDEWDHFEKQVVHPG